MSIRLVIYGILLSCFFFSCSKKNDSGPQTQAPPDQSGSNNDSSAGDSNQDSNEFDVLVSSESVDVGESVIFVFGGNPDVVTFYSGEFGTDYEFKDKERTFPATTSLSFKTAMSAGDNDDFYHFSYSTDFNGTKDSTSISEATWTDITEKFNIVVEHPSSGYSYHDAGDADISDIFPEDTSKPIYFCWYFTTEKDSKRTILRVADFNIKLNVDENSELSYTKYDLENLNFEFVHGYGFELQPERLPDINNNTAHYGLEIFWNGAFNSTSFKEGWAVSGPIKSANELTVGNDIGLEVKSKDDGVDQYEYTYSDPGEYSAVFVGSIDGKEVVKKIDITVK